MLERRVRLVPHHDSDLLGEIDFGDGCRTPLGCDEAPDLVRELLSALPPHVVTVLAHEALARVAVPLGEDANLEPQAHEEHLGAEACLDAGRRPDGSAVR